MTSITLGLEIFTFVFFQGGTEGIVLALGVCLVISSLPREPLEIGNDFFGRLGHIIHGSDFPVDDRANNLLLLFDLRFVSLVPTQFF